METKQEHFQELEVHLPFYNTWYHRLAAITTGTITFFFFCFMLWFISNQWRNLCEGKTKNEQLMKTDIRKRHLDEFDEMRKENNQIKIEQLQISPRTIADSYTRVVLNREDFGTASRG